MKYGKNMAWPKIRQKYGRALKNTENAIFIRYYGIPDINNRFIMECPSKILPNSHSWSHFGSVANDFARPPWLVPRIFSPQPIVSVWKAITVFWPEQWMPFKITQNQLPKTLWRRTFIRRICWERIWPLAWSAIFLFPKLFQIHSVGRTIENFGRNASSEIV